VHGAVSKWAKEAPERTAIIEFDTGRHVTYREFDNATTAWSFRLIELGYRSGDFLATMLPLTVEHIFLEYACFKIGVIHAPLDMRLKSDEVIRSLDLIRAKGFVTLSRTSVGDFSEITQSVRDACDYIEHVVQFSVPDRLVTGALPAETLTNVGPATRDNPKLAREFEETRKRIQPTDGAQVLYTTGSTGLPKPALLSHQHYRAKLVLGGRVRMVRHKADAR
jgi:acyl-CoA synthetase (AMP-forming)/AMP-acid ligase II